MASSLAKIFLAYWCLISIGYWWCKASAKRTLKSPSSQNDLGARHHGVFFSLPSFTLSFRPSLTTQSRCPPRNQTVLHLSFPKPILSLCLPKKGHTCKAQECSLRRDLLKLFFYQNPLRTGTFFLEDLMSHNCIDTVTSLLWLVYCLISGIYVKKMNRE